MLENVKTILGKYALNIRIIILSFEFNIVGPRRTMFRRPLSGTDRGAYNIVCIEKCLPMLILVRATALVPTFAK